MNFMNVAMMVLCAVGMSACGSKGGTVAALNAVTPGLVSPGTGDGSGDGTDLPTLPVAQDVSVITYTVSRQQAVNVNGVNYAPITLNATCMTYATHVFCFDDGTKSFNYAPGIVFNYSYFMIGTNTTTGAMDQIQIYPNDFYASAKLINPNTNPTIDQAVLNNIFATGTTATLDCTVDADNTTLTCPSFTVDLNQ